MTDHTDLIARLRGMVSIRRDSTPLSVALMTGQEAADALEAQGREIERLRSQLNAEREFLLPPFGHAFTVPVDRLDEAFLGWLRQHCVIVTEAEYESLRARLTEAERFKDGLEWEQRRHTETLARLAESEKARDQYKKIVDRYCQRHDARSCACEFGDDSDDPISQCNYHLDLSKRLAKAEALLTEADAEGFFAGRDLGYEIETFLGRDKP